MKSGNRDARLSMLKVLGSLGVVLVHTSMYTLNHRQVETLGWWIANLGNTAGRNMSSLFAMVAGAVLLARAIEEAPSSFVAQRLRRLLPAVVVWSAFYFFLRRFNGEALTPLVVARDLAFGMPSFHLWFLFAMLGLYVLMPGVRLFVRDEGEGEKATQYFIAGVLAAATCVSVIGMVALGHSPMLFISYTPLLLVYLVYGYLIYRDRPACSALPLWLTAAVCVGGTMLIVRFMEPSSGRVFTTFVQALRAPLALGWVLIIFLLVMQWKMPNRLAQIVNRVAPLTLGIYVMHPFWIDMVDQWLLPFKQGGSGWIAAAVCAYTLSAVSSWGIARIPHLRNLVT